MAGWTLMRSPRSMVRLAIMPKPFPGIGATMNGGSRLSFGEAVTFSRLEEKAGNPAITRAIEGFVTMETPRPS